MRSHLTTLLAAAFVCAGTGSAIAFVGGAHVGLEASGSASCEQYRPGNGFGDTNHCHTGPPGQTGEHPPAVVPPPAPPPASHFSPSKASASVSTRGSAKVQCPFACHIVLRVRHGHKLVRVSATLRAGGKLTLHLSKRQLKRLGRGAALETVEVNGKVISKRTVRFG